MNERNGREQDRRLRRGLLNTTGLAGNAELIGDRLAEPKP